MARGVNKVILVGNLGNDPDTRYAPSGTAITTISIATSEQWTDKHSGQKQERTEWHRVKFFGKLAEIAGEYLKKGRQVYVEGSLRTEKYTDKQGIERYTTDVIGSEMQMLGGSGDGARSGGGGGGGRGQSRRGDGPPGASRPPPGTTQPPAHDYGGGGGGGGDLGDFDDDIPF